MLDGRWGEKQRRSKLVDRQLRKGKRRRSCPLHRTNDEVLEEARKADTQGERGISMDGKEKGRGNERNGTLKKKKFQFFSIP